MNKPLAATLPLAEPGSLLADVLELYEQGRYLDSYAMAAPLGDIRSWEGPQATVMAGRLANNLGAPRLGRALHWRAYRKWPDHPYCLYYGCMAYWSRFGTVHTWRKFRDVEMPREAEPRANADWAATKALLLATMRDFSRAEYWMQQAFEIDPNSAWLYVERAELLDRQDRTEEALDVAMKALEIQPWFRPAVQSAAYKLIQFRRDDDAQKLLQEATEHLQSGEVWCQLAVLQQELKLYEESWESLQRAEGYWKLASADSQHKKWLVSQFSDLAYYRGDYDRSLELARDIDRPFYQRLVERLEKAIANPIVGKEPRVQLQVPFIRQHHETCAPATLTALAQYWNHSVQHEEIVERICYEGTAASDERRWAEENDFVAREFRITEEVAEQLIREGIPFTLNTVDPGSAHLQSIVGIDVYRGTFLIQDPSERHVSEASAGKLLEHYSSTGPRGMVLVPVPEANRLDKIALPDAELYDLLYRIDRAIAVHERGKAAEAHQQMTETAPEHRLTLQAGMTLARYDSNTPEQLRLTEKLLKQFPNDSNLLLAQLYCLSELGTREQRIGVLRQACDSEKSHPIFWSRLAGELSDDARDHDEAIWRLRRVLRGHQSDGRSLSTLASLLWDHQQRPESLELYRLSASISDKDEISARSYFSAARYLGETQTALDWLTDRNERFGSRSSQPARTLAGAYEMLDRTQEAIDLLEAACVRHPEDGDLHCYVALTCGRYNMREQASQHLTDAKGKCSETVFMRTSALNAMYQGKSSEARELFIQVLARDPLDTSTLERIVELDLDLDGPAVAEQRLRAAVEQFPHSYSIKVSLIQWLRSNRLSAALPEIDTFLRQYPTDAWGHRESAIVNLLSHNLEAAKVSAARAMELDPNNDTAHFIAGRIALDAGETEAARHHFRDTLRRNCDHESAISALLQTCDRPSDRKEQLAFILQQLQSQTTVGDGLLAYRDAAVGKMEPDAILAGLEEAIKFRPDLWQSWTAMTQQLMAMNQRERAVQIATEGAERFPLVPRMWVDLALVHRSMGNEADELAALERAREINPNWSEVARELSESYLRSRRFQEAEEVLRGVLAVDPRDPGSLASLADCLYRADRKQEAVEPMKQACIHAPGYTWAWQTLNEWSRELDAAASVKQAAQTLIDQRPHDVRGYLHYAEACNEIDEIPEGLQAIEQALQIDPRDVDVHVLKAFYLGRLHRWDEALEACQPTIFADAQPVALMMRRAYVLYRKGQLRQAADEMRSALNSDIDHYQAWNQLADWSEELGDEVLYREASENLVRIDPHQPVPYGYLADALLRENQDGTHPESRTRAKEYLLRAIQLSPEYAYATQRLVELELEDNNFESAQQALDLGSRHLPEGYPASLQIRIDACRSKQGSPTHAEVAQRIIQWCHDGPHVQGAMVRAVDQLESVLGQVTIDRLIQESKHHPDLEHLGVPLGRLIARLQSEADVIKTLNAIPEGSAWHKTARLCLRSLTGFERPATLLISIMRKFRKQLRAQTESWSSIASTLLDFGRNTEVLQWTKDWRKRDDLTSRQLIAVIAANWEAFQLKAARDATAKALQQTAEDADGTSDLVHTWAGIDALITGDPQAALQHAQQIDPHQLNGWYALGYQILVSAIEATPGFTENTLPARQTIRSFDPRRFPLPPAFQSDKLTQWFLLKIQASLAKMYGSTTNQLLSQSRAWWLRWN